jgi:hypothetical protein
MMKTATLIILTLALCGCLPEAPKEDIDAAVRACLDKGGAPDFLRGGNSNSAPVYGVNCYGAR